MLIRRYVIATLIVIGFAASIVGVRQYLKWKDHDTLLAERRLARAAGIPIEPDDLRPNPPVPDSDNAGILFKQAHLAYYPGPGKPQNKPVREASRSIGEYLSHQTPSGYATIHMDEPLPPGAAKANAAQLQLLAPLFRVFREGSERPKCDFQRPWEEGVAVLMPEFATLKQFTKCLSLRARLEALSAHHKSALQDLLACAKAASLIRQEPTAIALLVSLSNGKIAMKALRGVLNDLPNDPFWIENAPKVLDALEFKEDLRTIIYGDVVGYRASLEMLSTEKGLEDMGLKQEDLDQGYRSRTAIKDKVEIVVLQEARAILAAWPKDPSDFEGIRNAVHGHGKKMDDAVAAYSKVFEILSGPGDEGVSQRLEQMVDSVMGYIAETRLTRQLVAALARRRTAGAFPKQLPLVGELAEDPFNPGGRFFYQAGARDLLMYSVGKNRRDDRAHSKDEKHPNADDIVVRFPVKRRAP